MTRSFGDLVAKSVGVIAMPEIKSFQLTKESKFVILASDGLWDRISSDEVVRIISRDYYSSRDAEGAVNFLV